MDGSFITDLCAHQCLSTSSSVKESKTDLTLRSTQTSSVRQLWLTHLLTGGSRRDMISAKEVMTYYSRPVQIAFEQMWKNQRGTSLVIETGFFLFLLFNTKTSRVPITSGPIGFVS